MSKLLDLAKKLKALSEQGEGGEKRNATTMLESLIKKHGIKLDDLEEEKVIENRFKLTKDEEKLFIQVASVTIDGVKIYGINGNKTARKHITFVINCTAAEALEIRAKFEFYKQAWNKDLKLFFRAFIHKNHLAISSKGEEDEKELTSEELADIYRMAQMMKGMDKHQFLKQLKQ